MSAGTGRNGRDLPPGFDLRPATAEDAPLVLALTLEAYEEYRTTLVPESGVFHETVELVRAQLGATEGMGVQARRRGATGGMAARGDEQEEPGGGRQAPRSGGIIASIDGVPVGCARWLVRGGDDEDPAAHLHVARVAVMPAWRGRGVATALMGAFEDLAASRGLSEIRLAVRLTLPRNEAFYRSLGYRPTGRLETREGFGPIALWMSKRMSRRG